MVGPAAATRQEFAGMASLQGGGEILPTPEFIYTHPGVIRAD